jgi:serine/threonine-protein kinase RsbW
MPLSGPTAHSSVLRLTLACNLAEVRRAALTLYQFLAGQGCTEREVLDSELALVEACNNAILHADEAGRSHSVLVEASCNPLEIEMRITDHTHGFEMPQKPVLPGPNSERGRGLYLIQTLMDSADYKRGSTENTLVLRKRRSLL